MIEKNQKYGMKIVLKEDMSLEAQYVIQKLLEAHMEQFAKDMGIDVQVRVDVDRSCDWGPELRTLIVTRERQ